MTNDATPEEIDAIRESLKRWSDKDWERMLNGRLTILPIREWAGILQEVGWRPDETPERAGYLLYGDRADGTTDA